MSAIRKKERVSKRPVVTAKDVIHIGLDVHKKSIHVAVWKNGAVDDTWVAGSDYSALCAQLEVYRPAVKSVAYEAGPTGFALARLLEAEGFKTIVCAPSKTPVRPGDETKCDRLDARKIAVYTAQGLLTPVTIPTEAEECQRSLVRLRDQLAKKIRRAKQQIKGALLFHQCGSLNSWSAAERGRLLDTELPAEVRFALDSHFRELDFLDAERRKVDIELRATLKRRRQSETIRKLETHPGVGPVVSACFVLELFRPRRFKHGDAVARYVGLAPRVRQSGESCRGGSLLKAGQGRLRSLLLQSAWRWRACDERARAIYNRLLANTGNGNKAIVGLARRLAIRLWTMWIRGEAYEASKGACT